MHSITLKLKAVAVTLLIGTFLSTSYMLSNTACNKIKKETPSTEQNSFRDEPPWDGLGY